MSIFTQSINPLTGVMEWEEKERDYDYYQEIARSAFADMLHDQERNKKYYLALREAIEKKQASGEEANVLDIGTGTGLLSMMAAKCGADSIIACEAFKPIADCARQIIRKNGYEKKIKLVHKRSTNLTVGDNCDMPKQANILVTEVFDTELIGESALSTIQHAVDVLLEKDSIVIPSSGTIWVQVVESIEVRAWNRINPIIDIDGKVLIEPPINTQICSGASAVHDIQLSQVPPEFFKPLLPPQPIFKFDWTGKTPLVFEEMKSLRVQPITEGTAHAIFFWWDLNMDMTGKILLSCAPIWEHPDALRYNHAGDNSTALIHTIPWRDHWMQAIYYLPLNYPLIPQKEVTLVGAHDEYSFWFSMNDTTQFEVENIKRPQCECCVHIAFSRTRIGQWNDLNRSNKFLNSLRTKINPKTVCLSISDGSLLGLAVAKLGAKKVYVLETNSLSRRTTETFIVFNNLSETVEIIDSVDKLPPSNEINFIFAEPYYVSAILPWDNMRFWYIASRYSLHIPRIPVSATMKSVAVEFKDLQKIRASLGTCEGFDMTTFDKLVQFSSNKTDSPIEAQPLWEYPGFALSSAFTIAKFDFTASVNSTKNMNVSKNIAINSNGTCNGIAIWMDWQLDNETIVSSGPVEDIIPNNRILWDRHSRQGVHLLRDAVKVSNENLLSVTFTFVPKDGKMEFNFNIIQSN